MKKAPACVRHFEWLTAVNILLGVASSVLAHRSMAARLGAAAPFSGATGYYLAFAGAVWAATFTFFLAFLITRQRIEAAKWVFVVLFALGLPMTFLKPFSGLSNSAAETLSLARTGLEAYLVYLLFTSDFKMWLSGQTPSMPGTARTAAKRSWLVPVFLVFAALFVSVLVFAYIELKPLISSLSRMPQTVADKVLMGDGHFQKKTFYQDTLLGPISDIAVGPLDPAVGVAVGACGLSSAIFLDGQGDLLKTVSLGMSALQDGHFVPQPGQSSLFFNGGSWISGPALYDHAGNQLWHQGRSANGGAVGDFSGDGRLEFAVCSEGQLSLLDEAGKQLWVQQHGWIWHVEIASLGAGQRPSIIYVANAPNLAVLAEDGSVVSQAAPSVQLTHFCLLPWPSPTSDPQVLSVDNEKLSVLSPSGTLLATWPAPGCDKVVGNRAIWFQASPTALPQIVLAASVVGGSVLLAYDVAGTGSVVYGETRADQSTALAALPGPAGQSLLVGGNGSIEQWIPTH
jgi:hypothetical protein